MELSELEGIKKATEAYISKIYDVVTPLDEVSFLHRIIEFMVKVDNRIAKLETEEQNRKASESELGDGND